MLTWFVKAVLIPIFVGASVPVVYAQHASCTDMPKRHLQIFDQADSLTPGEQATLSEVVQRHRQGTGFEIQVLTVSSLCGTPIEIFSQKVAQTWNIGRPNFDDGALILYSKEGPEIHVWLGQGLSAHIPQSRIHEIVNENFIQEFRRGHVGTGLFALVSALAAESRSVKTAVTVPEVSRYFFSQAVFWSELIFFALPILFGFTSVTGMKLAILRRSIKRIRTHSEKSSRNPIVQLARTAATGIFLAMLSKLRNGIYAAHVEERATLEILDKAQNATAIAVWVSGTWAHHPQSQRSGAVARLADYISRQLTVPGSEQRDAVVRQRLKELHPIAVICRYTWYSTNSQTARLEAAKTLRERLIALVQSTGPVPIYLVGHSHGGSVALLLAEIWDQPSDIQISTIGTPFIRIRNGSTVEDGGLTSTIDKAASHAAITMYSLPIFLGMIFVCWVFWYLMGNNFKSFSWIPNADQWKLIQRPDLNVLDIASASIVAWGYINISYTLARGFGRQKLDLQRSTIPWGDSRTVGPDIRPLRIAQDELLNAMLAVARIHRLRLAVCIFQQRQAVDFLGRKVALNTALAVTLLVAFASLSPRIYSLIGQGVAAIAPTLQEEQLAFVAYLGVLCCAAALACILRIRLAIASGAIAAEVLWDVVFPLVNLLTFAQSRLAGIPMGLLAAGYVRIDDRPGSSLASIVPATVITNSAKPKHRHSACITEPGMWERMPRSGASNLGLWPQTD